MKLSILRNKSILTTLALGIVSVSSGFSTTITLGGTNAADNSGKTTSVLGATVTNFNNWSAPSTYKLSGTAGIVSGNFGGLYHEPTDDTTPYLTTGTGSVKISFSSAPIEYFGFYWSSVDSYNTIEFTNTLGQKTDYTGSALAALGATVNGTQSDYVNFFANAGEQWSSVTLSSSSYAFEVDNIASSTAPEPASLASVGLGIALTAFGVSRRRKARAQVV